MKLTLEPLESCLLWAVLAAMAFACFGPFVPQAANYHGFADHRTLAHLPFAMDVLSNLPFALAGFLGLRAVATQLNHRTFDTRLGLAALFFAGLLLTAAGSSAYHWHPDNVGLLWDRLGMVAAFAGLLGLAVADRISPRAGLTLSMAVLLAGPVSVLVWNGTGNLLPWVVLQGGGMWLLAALALRKPLAGAWNIPLGVIIGFYVLAKLFELGDHAVFSWTAGMLSGHSIKHLVAALAAWPVIAVMHNAVRHADAVPCQTARVLVADSE